MKSKITVAVFFGGNSNEREISVITGMLAANLLRETYRIVPVYLLPEGGMATGAFRGPADFKKGSKTKFVPVHLAGRALFSRRRKVATIDCALNCCHGGQGEDGTLSALLRFHGVPSASPEVPMSAVFMDKILTKVVARGLDIPTLPAFFAYEGRGATYHAEAEALGYPVIVKPARLGSSIGIKVAKDAEELDRALDLAFRLDSAALVEAYAEGKRDVNCAAYRVGGETVLSPLEEVFSDREILTFSEKYERNTRTSELPARLKEETAARIRTYTKLLYETFGGRGVVRADFLIAGDEVYFNELNTVPGSLACHLFSNSLTGSRDFLIKLIEETLNEPPMSKEVLVSGILEGDLFGGGKSAKKR